MLRKLRVLYPGDKGGVAGDLRDYAEAGPFDAFHDEDDKARLGFMAGHGMKTQGERKAGPAAAGSVRQTGGGRVLAAC